MNFSLMETHASKADSIEYAKKQDELNKKLQKVFANDSSHTSKLAEN